MLRLDKILLCRTISSSASAVSTNWPHESSRVEPDAGENSFFLLLGSIDKLFRLKDSFNERFVNVERDVAADDADELVAVLRPLLFPVHCPTINGQKPGSGSLDFRETIDRL